MKPIGIIITTALFLVLGIAAPAGAWQDKPDKQQEKDKPAKQEQAAKPERQQRQQQDNAAKQQQARGQQDQQRQQRQQQDNAAKQQQARGQQDQQPQQRQQQQAQQSAQRRSPVQVRQQQVAWQGSRAHSWQSEHRTWQQRGGYRGYRVPEDRFRGYYGQVFVGGRQRFQYGGYWFGLVDPWPEYWDSDWYDNDDVYVDYYGDGYYLYNRRYPNDRIAISFYLN